MKRDRLQNNRVYLCSVHREAPCWAPKLRADVWMPLKVRLAWGSLALRRNSPISCSAKDGLSTPPLYRMHVRMYSVNICICIYIYVYIYICIHMLCMYVYMYMYMSLYMYNVYVYVFVYAYAYAYVYVCTYVGMYACMYACVWSDKLTVILQILARRSAALRLHHACGSWQFLRANVHHGTVIL